MNNPSILFAFLSAFLMGTIGVFSKLTGLPAEIITFYRLFLGALFMLLFLLFTKNLKLIKANPSLPVIINGVFLAGFIIFYVQAMNYTSMANAIMLVYLAPVAASVFAHCFMSEKLNIISTVLIGVALLGFCLMMEMSLSFVSDSSELLGITFGGLSLVCYAGFILINRIISAKVHVYTSTFYQLLVGAVVMIPLCIGSFSQVQPHHLPWLGAVGLFPGFLGILFAVLALSKLPAATFGTIAYIEPVAVVMFGFLIFHESLSVMQICGCILIIGSGIAKTITAKNKN